jgi:hypothetical protein
VAYLCGGELRRGVDGALVVDGKGAFRGVRCLCVGIYMLLVGGENGLVAVVVEPFGRRDENLPWVGAAAEASGSREEVVPVEALHGVFKLYFRM